MVVKTQNITHADWKKKKFPKKKRVPMQYTLDMAERFLEENKIPIKIPRNIKKKFERDARMGSHFGYELNRYVIFDIDLLRLLLIDGKEAYLKINSYRPSDVRNNIGDELNQFKNKISLVFHRTTGSVRFYTNFEHDQNGFCENHQVKNLSVKEMKKLVDEILEDPKDKLRQMFGYE